MANIKGLTGLDKLIYKLDLRLTVRSMIGNIKKLFLPKNLYICRKSNFLQDPGYVEDVEGSCCMLHATLQEIPNVEGIKRNKNTKNRLDLRPLFLMLKVLKIHAGCCILHDTLQGNIQC